MYSFNENTPPKEIISAVLLHLADELSVHGFKFLKSKPEFKKSTSNFIYSLSMQNNRNNLRGYKAEIIIHCSIEEAKTKTVFWEKTLASSNAKQDQHQWINFFGKENYQKNLEKTIKIIKDRLLPYFNRLETDLENLVEEISEKGFCVFNDTPVYDAGYQVPVLFLEKYGTKEQMTKAFQNYIDRHELDFVKPNFQQAVLLLKKGEEVTHNGEKDHAQKVVEKGIELHF